MTLLWSARLICSSLGCRGSFTRLKLSSSDGSPLVSVGEQPPVKTKRLQTASVFPQVEWLFRVAADAMTGRPIEVDADVQPMLLAQLHGPVLLGQRFIMNVESLRGRGFVLAALDPEAIAQRQADEIKSSVHDPSEVVFPKKGRRDGRPQRRSESSPSG